MRPSSAERLHHPALPCAAMGAQSRINTQARSKCERPGRLRAPVSELFVDESCRHNYLLCAAVVPAADIATARKIMRSLTPNNRHRLHMKSETRNRDKIIRRFVEQPPISHAHIFIGSFRGARRSQRQVRTQCLQGLAEFAADTHVRRILVESCAQDKQDRAALTDVLASRGSLDRIRVDVDQPTAHELLWAADLMAWAYGAGGAAREAISQFVTTHELC